MNTPIETRFKETPVTTLCKLATGSLAVITLSMGSTLAMAQSAEERGLEIAKAAKASDLGWQDMQAEMLMTLRNQQGEESVREIRTKSLEIHNDGDKGLTIFDKPLDVKGTAFLSFSHPVEADEQWIYLPALKRVKRISSRNKSGPFMGSEFAYEDLSSFEIEKYSYKFVGEAPCETDTSRSCYQVESYPVDKNSGYTRQIVSFDTETYRPMQIVFYDRKDSLLKTLSYTGYQQYLGKHWRADTMSMVNHQNGKSTELNWSNYQFKQGLDEGDFNKNSLKRVR